MRLAAVLVALPVLVVLAACTPTSEPSPSPTPIAESTSPTPTVTPSPTGPTFVAMDPALFYVNGLEASWSSWESEDVNFASPSGGIGCGIMGEEHHYLWGCAITEKDWTFPSASPDDYCFESPVPCGFGIEATGEELPHPRKRGDPGFPGAFAASGTTDPIRVLQYGESVTFGNVTCFSEEIGITCENSSSGHGFVISRDRNEIY